jgi:2,3-dihydroxybenzoate-AMP ligase
MIPTTTRTETGADHPTWPPEFAERYRDRGYWRGETLGEFLRGCAGRFGDRVALVDGPRRITYRELDARADRLAAGLRRLGIRAGDRVVVQLPNGVEFCDVLFALARLGAVPVCALPAHRQSEIGYFCAHTEAVACVVPDVHQGFDHRALAAAVGRDTPSLRHVLVVGDPGGHTALADCYLGPAEPAPVPEPQVPEPPVPKPQVPEPQVSEPRASDVALLQLSGGSTGVPKLIPRTHDDYLYSVRASAEICGLGPDSVYLCVLPVAHNFPLSSPGVLGTLYAGGRVVMCPAPSPDVAFPLVEREGVTVTGLVPPLALLWLEAAAEGTGDDLSSLRLLQVGGAKLPAEAARRVAPGLGCQLQQVFGMAEGLVNYTRLDDPDPVVEGTQGRPISADDEILVLDDEDHPVPAGATGHLLTRGPYTVRGYYRAADYDREAFTPDGFYRTGDLVRVTATGHLVVEGRAKEQINRGGEKVAAEEVEAHILAHPGVRDAAVVAAPDPYLGERTCAFVVPARGAAGSPLTGGQVRSFVRDRGLAAYKVPDRVEVVPDFPVTGVGKISRRALRAALRDRLGAGREA